MQKYLVNIFCALLCAGGQLVTQSALATDYSFSGFGTIGYAQSNQSYNYQRYINKSGTFMRDTVLGAQVDAKFNPEWGATVQVKLAPAIDSDSSWRPMISWAFLSYRPGNDWLVRVGKLRVPFYLNSENMDVGATFTAARLPIEAYSISPTMDFNGASFVKTWALGDNELNLDGFWGQADVPWRTYTRDTATPYWSNLKIEPRGLLLTLHQEANTYRIGYSTADVRKVDGSSFPVTMTPVTLNPLSGMSGTFYPPPSQTTSKMTTPAINLGVDVGLGHGFRTMGEYVRHKINGVELGPDTESFYLSLLNEMDRWAPYITYAQIKSKNLVIYQAVNGARVTSTGAPQAQVDAINAAQRAAADGLSVYDQNSWSLGTSYLVTRTSKIKAEWSVVHTGAVSSFVDAPVGGESGNLRINVYSLSYNFMF